jgi:hypothetical protein
VYCFKKIFQDIQLNEFCGYCEQLGVVGSLRVRVLDQGRPDAVRDGGRDPGAGGVAALLDEDDVARVEPRNSRKLWPKVHSSEKSSIEDKRLQKSTTLHLRTNFNQGISQIYEKFLNTIKSKNFVQYFWMIQSQNALNDF